ncbi:MAG TPA: DUF4012 domain-containing protein [Acidimicrobiales bacterium]|nr:DUF4012 domain-containing protein [Acidimicrobiales bacterium]
MGGWPGTARSSLAILPAVTASRIDARARIGAEGKDPRGIVIDAAPALAVALAAGLAAVATLANLRREHRLSSEGRSPSRRRHRGQSSGTILMVAAAAGTLAVGPGGDDLALLGGAVLVGLVGVLADRRVIRPGVRLGAEGAAGVLAVLLGVETTVTALALADALVVVAVVVVAIEATRLLDAAPRVAAGVFAPLAVAVYLLAWLGPSPSPSVLVATLAGAVAAMLAVGVTRPFWLGESGCLFTGFVLAGAVLGLETGTARPSSLLVVLPLLAIPLYNLAVVALGRLRRRLPLTQRRPDGIAHRLRARGMPWRSAVLVLAGLQTAVGGLAVAADAGWVPLATVPAAGLAAILALSVPAVSSRKIHRHDPAGWSQTTRLVAAAAVAAGLILVVPATVALVAARGGIQRGIASAEAALQAVRLGELETAQSELAQAQRELSAAERSLGNPLTSPGLAVPLVGPHLAAGRRLSASAAELAATGTLVAGGLPQQLVVRESVVPIEEIRGLEPELVKGAAALRGAEAEMAEADLTFLLPPLRRRAEDLVQVVTDSAADAELAIEAVGVLPAFFGGEGERRYFVALQNPAEQRGSGGIVGNFVELSAVDGRLDLTRTGRVAELNFFAGRPPPLDVVGLPSYLQRYAASDRPFVWQDATLSPDFPSVATAIEALYPRYGGQEVDGVISLDPLAIAALLELTGPVAVAEWPEPIDSTNAADILLRQQYLRLADEAFSNLDRVDFLDSLVAAVFERIELGVLPPPARLVRTLGPLVDQGRIQIHSRVPAEQSFIERIGADGALPPATADALALVTNNSVGNKIDIFLQRSLSYRVAYDPETGQVRATAEVRLRNDAPSGGLPDYVIGSSGPVSPPPGTNRIYLSLYTPLDFEGATLGPEILAMSTTRENGRNAHSAFVTIPPGGEAVVSVELAGQVPAGSSYRLDLGHQPTIVPDDVTVAVEAPPGWKARATEGFGATGAAPAVSLRPATPRTFTVEFAGG